MKTARACRNENGVCTCGILLMNVVIAGVIIMQLCQGVVVVGLTGITVYQRTQFYLALICMATKSFAYQLSFNNLMVPFPSDDKLQRC